VTFIIDVRGGGPSSGYISAGFFGGMLFHKLTFAVCSDDLFRSYGWPNSAIVGQSKSQYHLMKFFDDVLTLHIGR
jgi:hypothetical protein